MPSLMRSLSRLVALRHRSKRNRAAESREHKAESPAPEPETPYGRRLLPVHIAEVARTDPDRLMCIISSDRKTYAKGARRITYRNFERAVDRTAWWLEKQLGKSTSFDTLAYLGPNDLRYFLLLIACTKVGYRILFTSPRNSPSNHAHLLNKTNCGTFLKAEKTNVDHIAGAYKKPLKVVNVPELEDLLLDEDVAEYPYNRSFEDAKNDPCLVIHSSGTTGQVKPIPWTHRSLASFDCHNLLKDENGNKTIISSLHEGPMLVTMPFFHAACVFMGLLTNIWLGAPAAFPCPDVPPSVPGIVEAIKTVEPAYAMLAPSTVEEFSQSQELLEVLEKLKLVIYAGGSINDRAGAIVAQHTGLQSYLGTSESGGYPIYPLTDHKEEFSYLRFSPKEAGIEFRHHHNDLYELVHVRHKGPAYESTFDTFPDASEYPSSDLYKAHPSKPGYWKHSGRADDVIVLSNSEKVVPSAAEWALGQAKGVRAALLYGQGRFEVAALIELEPAAQDLPRDELIATLEPHIQQVNKEVPSHAQLSKDRIVFATPDRPFLRLPKGTVIRKSTFELYDMEIDAVYSSLEGTEVSEKPLLKDVSEEETVAQLTDLISKIGDVEDLPRDQDYLQAGVDSLKVITIVRRLRKQVDSEGADVSPELINSTLVYSNPTVQALAKALRNLGTEVEDEEAAEKHVEEMKQMIEKYTKDLPEGKSAEAAPTSSPDGEISVILTGSTGSLGSYLLNALLANKRVVRVFCLNRSEDGLAKQQESSSARGLTTEWADRVQFLRADLSKPQLGLEPSQYELVASTATHIIHGQWPVNFNIPLRTFEPHVQGVRHLVDLAAASPHRPPILLTSTIAVQQRYAALHDGAPAPEAAITDPHVLAETGYSRSKYVAESILAAAAAKSGVLALIVRVGQLAGSVAGRSVWSRDEWFPSILVSAQHLGVLPSSLGWLAGIEFVPIDVGASALVDLATSDRIDAAGGAQYFAVVNPHPVRFTDLLPALQAAIKPEPRLVSLREWVDAVRASAADPKLDAAKVPAVKLLDFYESIVAVAEAGAGGEAGGELKSTADTANALAWSESMRKLEPVQPAWAEAWVRGLDL